MKTNIPLQVIDMQSNGYHLLVTVNIAHKKYKVVLDTGASKTVFDQELLLQAGITAQATNQLSAGLGTLSMASFTALLPVLKIGKLRLTGFEVAVLDLSTINQAYAQLNHPQVLGVLGGDILMAHHAIIDYGKQKLRLQVSP